jgi:RNase P subunit RPR2
VSVLKVTCPRCRTEVDTGVAADEHTLHECREIAVLVLCDECREYHRMLVKDLYLAA